MTRRVVDVKCLTAFVLLLVLISSWAFAAPYVILKKSNKRYVGTGIKKMRNGDIVLTKDSNKMTFTKDQVKLAVADKPQAFDVAVRAVNAGKYDSAIGTMEKIVKNYSGLSWDIKIMPYLAKAYKEQGHPRKAIGTYEDMYARSPDMKNNDKISAAYCALLLQTKEMGKLKKKLDEMIKTGGRESAARAQVMRGDIKMSEKSYKDAAKDYLRTVYFFKKVDAVLPEATYKVAVSLEKLRDKRAKIWYKTVVEQFPGSVYAAKARKKL